MFLLLTLNIITPSSGSSKVNMKYYKVIIIFVQVNISWVIFKIFLIIILVHSKHDLEKSVKNSTFGKLT